MLELLPSSLRLTAIYGLVIAAAGEVTNDEMVIKRITVHGFQ